MDYSKPKSSPPTAPPAYGMPVAPPGNYQYVQPPVTPPGNYQYVQPPVTPPGNYQYVQPPPPHADGGPWSTGLCDCCSDVPNCCLTCWCPCITFGQIAEIVDKGSTSCGASGALYALIAVVTGCSCIYSCFYRKKMRTQYMLPESPCNDCLLHFCCQSCALCQEYRELKHRGFDMSIGWQGNVDRQGQGGAFMAPVVQGGMSR